MAQDYAGLLDEVYGGLLDEVQGTAQPAIQAGSVVQGQEDQTPLEGSVVNPETQRPITAALEGLGPTGGMTGGQAVQEAGKALVRGAGSVVASTVKGLGLSQQFMLEKVWGPLGVPGVATALKVSKAVQGAGEAVQGVLPEVDPRAGFLAGTLPEALGSGVGFMALGGAGMAAGAGSVAPVALVGALSNGAAGYDEARAKHATDNAAWLTFVLDAGIGLSEAVPLSQILARIDKGTGGGVERALRTAALEGVEELIQEVGQGVGQNVVAQKLYDKDRKILEGVAGQGAAGFLTGLLLSGAGTLVASQRRAEAGQPPVAPEPAPAVQPRTSTPAGATEYLGPPNITPRSETPVPASAGGVQGEIPAAPAERTAPPPAEAVSKTPSQAWAALRREAAQAGINPKGKTRGELEAALEAVRSQEAPSEAVLAAPTQEESGAAPEAAASQEAIPGPSEDQGETPPPPPPAVVSEDGPGAAPEPAQEKWLVRVASWLDRRFADRWSPLRAAERETRGTAREGDLSSYLTRMPGIATDLKEKANEVERKIGETARRAKISLPELDDYVTALHTPDVRRVVEETHPKLAQDPEYGTGMSEAEAAMIVQEAEAGPRGPAFKRAARLLRGLNQRNLAYMVETGRITQETADNLNEKWGKWWVPLRNAPDSPDLALVQPRGLQLTGPEFKRREGRKSRAASPVVWSFVNVADSISRGVRAQAGQQIAKLAREAGPDIGLRVLNAVETEGGGIRYETEDGEPVNLKLARDDGKVVAFKENGQQKYLIADDPQLVSTIKQLDAARVGNILRATNNVIATLKKTRTVWSPDWFVRNIARDIGDMFPNLTGEIGAAGSARAVANALNPALRKAVFDVEMRRRADGYWHRKYREAKAVGGIVGWIDDAKFQKRMEDYARWVKSGTVEDARRAFLAVGDVAHALVTANEAGTRLAAYDAAVKAGKTAEEAAVIAREVTVDFDRRGEWSPIVRMLWWFFQPNVTGNLRMGKALFTSKHRAQVWGIAAGMASMAAAMSALNRATDEERWDHTPWWQKSLLMTLLLPEEWQFKLPGTGITVDRVWLPMPYGYAVFHALGTKTEEMLQGKQGAKEAGAEMFSTVAQAFSPLGAASTVTQAVAPDVLDPFIQGWENTTTFGAPLYPTKYERFQPDAEQAWKSTSELYKNMARWMNSATGGDVGTSGAVDISPETLEMWADFLGAGALRSGERAADTVRAIGTGERFSVNRVPMVRSFLGDADPTYTIGEFYRAAEQVDRAEYQRKKGGDVSHPSILGLPWRKRAEATKKRISALRQAGDDTGAAEVAMQFIREYDQALESERK